MRRTLVSLIAIAAVVAAGGACALRSPAVQDRLIERVAASAMAGPGIDLFGDDALRVLLCGSSSPLPHPTRAATCVAVFAGGRFWVVDTGPGSWNNLALWRIPGQHIGAVLYTHFHSDHIAELGEFNLQTWVAGRGGPLRVFGPPGVDRVVDGFEQAYALDTRYRIAHHGAELLPEDASRMQPRPIAIPPGSSDPVPVLAEDGVRITMFAVDHAPVVPAVGYRFDFGGRSVVVSGDTVAHAGVLEAARGADLLLHEAQANHMLAVIGETAASMGRHRIAKIMSDIPDYHTTPVEAAQLANAAGVGLLLFYHLTPPPPNRVAESVFLRGVEEVRPDGWVLGDDGMLVELPVDSDEIVVRSID
jgi:ribonuclease Z